jgi:hypothetical protein
LKNIKEDFVVYVIKKFLNVAFQDETGSRAILRDSPGHILQDTNPFMCAETYSAGKRRRDKSFLKDRVYDGEDGVMQNAVADFGLVDMPLLRIADIEAGVGAVLVLLCEKIAMQSENIFFKPQLEGLDVMPAPLVAFKNIPCGK